SVKGLPLREVRRPALKPAFAGGHSRLTMWGMTWSRLAMAASIMLAIGAVAWTMHVNSTHKPMVAKITPTVGSSHEATHENASSLSDTSNDMDVFASASSSDEVDARVSYLLVTDQ